jgi:competence protein ComGC
MKIKKNLVTGIALGASAIALLIASTGVAQAHGSNGGSTANEGKRGGAGSSLVTNGTLTQAQATAVRDAMHAAAEAKKDAALAAMVTAGTLTQAQVDAFKAAAGVKSAMRTLIADGVFTQEQAQALRTSLKSTMAADRDARVDAVLSELVSKSTITQTQADAIKTSKAAEGERGHGKAAEGERGHGKGKPRANSTGQTGNSPA